MPCSPSPAACPSTSVIPAAPGNAGATKTPTGCCANTSLATPAWATEPRPNSTTSPTSSTHALDKPSAGRHHHKHSTERCDDPLSPAGNRCAPRATYPAFYGRLQRRVDTADRGTMSRCQTSTTTPPHFEGPSSPAWISLARPSAIATCDE